MSEAAKAQEAVEVVKQPSEPLFGKKQKKLMTDPLDDQNPITVQVLGICSALAITVQVQQAIVMALSVVFVMAAGNIIVSMIRNIIPSRIRIIVQLVIVAALVILVDQVLKAFLFEISQALSVFVGLIITNCIIMGRLEAFALGNKVWPSFLDGVGNAIGYGYIMVLVAIVREIFGSGSLSLPGIGQFPILPQAVYEAGYFNNNMMILPPMALVTVGIIIWIQRSRNTALIEEN